jgi:hypothetical protein
MLHAFAENSRYATACYPALSVQLWSQNIVDTHFISCNKIMHMPH